MTILLWGKSHSSSDAKQRGHLEVSVVVVGEYGQRGSDDVAQGLHGGQAAYADGHGGGDHGRTGARGHVHGVPDAAPRVDARVRERGRVTPGHYVVHGRVLPRLQVALEPVLKQREHEQPDEPDAQRRHVAPRFMPGQYVNVHQFPSDPPVRDHHRRDHSRGNCRVHGHQGGGHVA